MVGDAVKSILITVKAKPLHGVLYAAQKKCGRLDVLCERLGVCSASVIKWVSLRDYPRRCFENMRQFQVNARLALNARLFDLVGVGIDECWPLELREWIDAHKDFKTLTAEISKEIPLPRLTASMSNRLAIEHDAFSNLEKTETSERILQSLSVLTERQRTVVEMRYGLGGFGVPQTLEQVANTLGLQRERIRQIEAKALRILARPKTASTLVGLLD